MERRLLAVLSADVVQYSRLMAEDEQGTFDALKARKADLFLPTFAAHRGRLVKSTGDGFLVEFHSALDAVICARTLQAANREADSGRPAGRHLAVRVGIALADAMTEDGDIFGTGVNIAARLQSIAEPGGICISAAIMEQVKGKIEVRVRERGPQQLRNIAEPVVAFDLDPTEARPPGNVSAAPVAPAGEKALGDWTALLPELPSLAILPFDDLSKDGAKQYFCDGIAENLITEVSRFRSLFVISRNSSFRYRGGNLDLARIGRELNVRYVVEGSIQHDANRLRITIQLIDALTGFHVWAERYDFADTDLFAIQDEITRKIATALNNRLEKAELEALRRRQKPSLRAFDLWLQGAAQHEKSTPQALHAARLLYEEAIRVDPQFARPYAALAELKYLESVYAGWGDPQAFSDNGLDLAKKAVEADEQDAFAHSALGWAYMPSRQFARARLHMEKASSLNPNDADLAMIRATQLAFLGEPERASEVAQQAIRQNPFHPDWYYSELAVVFFFGRRFEEMQASYELVPEFYPHTPAWRAAAYGLEGDAPRARECAARFEANVRALWRGASDATARDFAQWFFDHLPLARKADLDLVAEGLQRAGLDVLQQRGH